MPGGAFEHWNADELARLESLVDRAEEAWQSLRRSSADGAEDTARLEPVFDEIGELIERTAGRVGPARGHEARSVSATTSRLWRFQRSLAAADATPASLRGRLYRSMGLDIRTEPHRIRSGLFVTGPRLTVGVGAFVDHAVFVENEVAPVVIGDRARIGLRVLLCTATHTIGPSADRAGEDVEAPVTIGQGAWIGAGATVLPGVTVGAGCVVAAGSVVGEDCAPDGLYAGVPARRVRDLT